MDYIKMLGQAVEIFERQARREITRMQRNRADLLQDIRDKKKTLTTARAVLKELTKPPKPFKMPKTYIGPDGKRRRMGFYAVQVKK